MSADWRYRALLIGNSVFTEDPHGLEELEGPKNDIDGLRRALTDEAFGLHRPDDVQVHKDVTADEMRTLVGDFFGDARDGEQLLFYYSGHGRRTLSHGELHLCAKDTRPAPDHRLEATAIGASYLGKQIQPSRATAKVVILDCCHSGAFDHRFRGGNVPYHLRGEGQFGLFSTQVLELSPDARTRGAMSPFTTRLVEALGMGSLDRDGDGFVDLEDVYGHILRTLRGSESATPTRSLPGPTVGTVALARAQPAGPSPDTGPAPAEPEPRWRTPASLIMPIGPPLMASVPPDGPTFRMSANLVTNRQFAQFLAEERNAAWRPGGEAALAGADGDYLRHWPRGGMPGALSEHPVVNVSAAAATAYLSWTESRWGVSLRLPRVGEWETAAWAGRPATEFVAADIADEQVNFRDTDSELVAVDEIPANPYGIGSLLGNAGDMCVTEAGDVVACGGSYWTPRQLLDSYLSLRADECRDDVGFRCVEVSWTQEPGR